MATSLERSAASAATQHASARTKLNVLLVEDSTLDVELILRELKHGGFDTVNAVVQTQEDFVKQIRAGGCEVVLADYNLPGWRGMEALDFLRQEKLDIPLILVSGALGEETAVECIKRGATDYVLKGRLTRLPVSIRRAIEEKNLRAQRRQAEAELAHKVEELARSNRELEQFAYVASHDLQEPLRMVASYTQLLAERYRGQLDEKADLYIGYAVDGAQRMQTLIQDLLAFSRVGRKQPEPSDVDCKGVMEEVVRNLASAIRESTANVTYDPLPVVCADRTHMLQLFQNLIGNAIKFRKSDPPAISVRAEDSGDWWKFGVIDNGIGIAREHFDVIFAVFQRLHTRTEYPGNGIGLAISKKIVEHYGGRIWVESTPGEGTTFHFTLPKAQAQS